MNFEALKRCVAELRAAAAIAVGNHYEACPCPACCVAKQLLARISPEAQRALERERAKARLEEAQWWRERSEYDGELCDARIAALEASVKEKT